MSREVGKTPHKLVNSSDFYIFAGIIWHKGQEGGNDCLCREEKGKMGAQMIFSAEAKFYKGKVKAQICVDGNSI